MLVKNLVVYVYWSYEKIIFNVNADKKLINLKNIKRAV